MITKLSAPVDVLILFPFYAKFRFFWLSTQKMLTFIIFFSSFLMPFHLVSHFNENLISFNEKNKGLCKALELWLSSVAETFNEFFRLFCGIQGFLCYMYVDVNGDRISFVTWGKSNICENILLNVWITARSFRHSHWKLIMLLLTLRVRKSTESSEISLDNKHIFFQSNESDRLKDTETRFMIKFFVKR